MLLRPRHSFSKLLSLLIVLTLLFGLLPQSSSMIARAQGANLASLVPADTFAFVDIDVTRGLALSDAVIGLFRNVGYTAPPTLIDALEASAAPSGLSIKSDVMSWLGEHIGLGVFIPKELFQSLFTADGLAGQRQMPTAEYAAIFTVKDEAAADAFVTKLIQMSRATFLPSETTINGEPARINTEPVSNMAIARWKGYVAIGNLKALLDFWQNKGATLDQDARYQKVLSLLKPDNAVTVFVRAPLPLVGASSVLTLALLGPAIGNVFRNIVNQLQQITPTPTPSPTPTPTPLPERPALLAALLDLGASGYGVRIDGKAFVIDAVLIADKTSADKISELTKTSFSEALQNTPKPVASDLAAKISSDAMVALIGSDMPQIYAQNKALLISAVEIVRILTNSSSNMPENVEQQIQQGEAMVEQMLGLKLNEDVFGWMGDFAVYLTPGLPGDLAAMSPVDFAAFIQTNDSAKTTTFIEKLNSLLTTMARVTPQKGSDGLYQLNNMQIMASSFSYGVVNDAALLATQNLVARAVSALRGDGVLASSEVWKRAAALFPEQYRLIAYIDPIRFTDMLIEAAKRQGQQMPAYLQQQYDLVRQFESALIINRQPEPLTDVTSYVALLK